jgi:hypothetical protein
MNRVDDDAFHREQPFAGMSHLDRKNTSSDYGPPFFVLPDAGHREKRGNPPTFLRALKTALSVTRRPKLHLR